MIAESVELTPNVFESIIGERFLVGNDHESEDRIELTLVEAVRSPRGHPGRLEPFSLIFEGAAEMPLNQGTYLFTHPEIGTPPIFIVPVSQDQFVRRYQAIFN